MNDQSAASFFTSSQLSSSANEVSWTRKMSLTLEDLFRRNTNQFQTVTENSHNNSQANSSGNNQQHQNHHQNTNNVGGSASKPHFQTPFLQTIVRSKNTIKSLDPKKERYSFFFS